MFLVLWSYKPFSTFRLCFSECIWSFSKQYKRNRIYKDKMKEKAFSGRVGYKGLYFIYSLEGHLHVLLSWQGVCLQKRHIDVINATAAHGIALQPLISLFSCQKLDFYPSQEQQKSYSRKKRSTSVPLYSVFLKNED